MDIYFATWRSKDSAELSTDNIDRLISDRGQEADRLISSLDDIMISPTDRTKTIARIEAIQDELRRADIVKRRQARRA